MKLPILGLLLIGAIVQQMSVNGNAINPDCTPKATTDTFDDTLIVLVFNFEDTGSIKEARNYILKQFACLIPITNNIKTSLLYIGNNETERLTNAHFMDSGKLVDELKKPFDISRIANTCYRLKNHLHEFKNDALVKTHENVHYVVLNNLKEKCIGLDQDINMWFLIYEERVGTPNTLSLMDDNGFLDPIKTQAPTSQPLEVFVENIVSNFLHEKNKPISLNLSWLVWLFIILVVFLLIFLVISWGIFVWWYRRMKRKIENKKKNKKKAKICAVLKPVPKPEIAQKKSQIKTTMKSENTPKSEVKTVDYDGVYKSSITKTEEMSSNIITEDASRTMKKRKDDFDDETY